jgi:flagellar hook protein FlgE
MSLTSAMYTGVSGLLNNGEAMNVIGNNISNVNTVGFKESRTLFSDLLSANAGNNSQVGKGVQMQAVQNIFTQGSSQGSENITDLSIQGNSFFALKAPNVAAPIANQAGALLTRAGAFKIDNNLTLVNPDGYQVLDTSGNPIKFSDNAAGVATAATGFNAAAVVAPAITAITTDIASVQAAVTAMPAGIARTAAQALVNAATTANTAATAANAALSGAPTGDTSRAASNAVATAYSALQAAAASSSPATAVPAATSTAVNAVATNYAPVTTEEGKAFGKITNISNSGVITYLAADGVTLNYYNGSNATGIPVASGAQPTTKIATVTAADPTALTKLGGSLYQINGNAGVNPVAFTGPNGTSEKILSNSQEQSNVDMASEFVKMIVTQRAYSANSKTITTTDQMTQEVLGLIR